MDPTKIVVIGAGSASFGLGTLATIIRSEKLRGSTLCLVDINAEGLETMTALARRLNREWNADMTIESSTDRTQVLDGTEFVILSIEVGPREELWKLDWEIPTRHDLRQPYGENGGPGGFARALRTIPVMLDIARDMERYCPEAWLINFSNPLPRLCLAVDRYTDIRVVGLCHQVQVAYIIVGAVLADELGIEVPPNLQMTSRPSAIAARHEMARRAHLHLDIKAAGLNHFTWMLDIRHKGTGEDLYPLFVERFLAFDRGFQPLTQEMLRILGVCPVPGDEHLAEYLPWMHDPLTKPWEKYDVDLYAWHEQEARRADGFRHAAAMVVGEAPVDQLKQVKSEGAAEIVEGIQGTENNYVEAVNVPNDGHITNLPYGAAVELPAVITGMGVQGLALGDLPASVAELCRREVAVQSLAVDAAVWGDRELALRALVFDPMIDDIDRARAILEDYLAIHADYLPQFHGRWSW
ncbi:MAG: Alpha-glucosidase [Anaerolineales bacterium]|nr:Alpha-glucosidase [Anaerolineales bacterium]